MLNIKEIVKEEINRLVKTTNNNIESVDQFNTEGVADKYAEKEFNIPDDTKSMDAKANQELQKNIEQPYVVMKNVYIGSGKGDVNVYINPKSLANFECNVRAIADFDGNLYVAQNDGDFNHGVLSMRLDFYDDFNEIYHNLDQFLLLNRNGCSNSFGLSDSSDDYLNDDEDNYDSLMFLLKQVEHKNPQYTFNLEFWNSDGYSDDNDSTLNEIELNVNELLKEQEDYRGSHTAPTKENDSPMHDLSNTYPEDIYGDPQKAARYYGDGFPYDIYSAYIIQSARNKPNKQIKIYRAVPDFNKDIDKEIKERYNITRYFDKYGFLPMKNSIVYRLEDKYSDYTGEKYDEGIQNILKDIHNEINELSKKKQNKITINDGDWVTINPAYAKEHGQSNLNNKFKILTKTVRANQLYTDGNSMHEWGYNI